MALATTRLTIPLTKPFLGDEEERAVSRALRSGWVAQGPLVASFERTVAEYVGAREGVATSNCTTALHLALLLHGIGPGDEVIVPSFTFIATANAVRFTGAAPVFADIDPRTYNLDPASVEAAITPRTRAVMPVHQLGLAADLEALSAVARRHGLILIEDAAPALGATHRGRRVGGLGFTACFSFHPRKVVTTGEGGMILTDDPDVAERARRLRAHGMSMSDLARHQASQALIEEYPEIGYNYRLSDLHAAVGLEQMRKLAFILARRRELAEAYDCALASVDGLQVPFSSMETPHTYQSYMIELVRDCPVSRSQLMQSLLDAGISTRRGVMAIHREAPYRERVTQVPLRVTERAADRTVLLPIYTTMSETEQEYVIEHLKRALAA